MEVLFLICTYVCNMIKRNEVSLSFSICFMYVVTIIDNKYRNNVCNQKLYAKYVSK